MRTNVLVLINDRLDRIEYILHNLRSIIRRYEDERRDNVREVQHRYDRVIRQSRTRYNKLCTEHTRLTNKYFRSDKVINDGVLQLN